MAPKPCPLMVTAVPTGPNTGDKLLIPGEELTVKLRPLLSTPPTVTTMLPVVAPAGTGTRIEVALQLSGVAAVPLNVTVLAPCVVPKLLPLSVTAVPMPPCLGEPEAMVGPVITVNEVGLLSVPPTLTTTFPVVAPVGTGTMIDLSVQLVADATVPLNATVLLPRLGPFSRPQQAHRYFPSRCRSRYTGCFQIGFDANWKGVFLRRLTSANNPLTK